MLGKKYQIVEIPPPSKVERYPLLQVGKVFVVRRVNGTEGSTSKGITAIEFECGTVYDINTNIHFWCFYTEKMVKTDLIEIF